MARTSASAKDPPGSARESARLGLSGKLFALTVCAIMLAEVVFYVPSVAQQRIAWLTDRLAAAHTAALVLRSEKDYKVSEGLQRELLDSIGARMVAMRIDQTRQVLATSTVHQQIR